MVVIRKSVPIKLVVHPPQTPEGQQALANRVADAHAFAVIEHIKALTCPFPQKLALVDAVIREAKQQAAESAQ